MNRYVALLRGINVGGHNKLPMAVLRELLGELGAAQVATYIQSGNAVFAHGDAAGLGERLSAVIDDRLGFHPKVLVLDATQFATVVGACPYAKALADPRHLHVAFLAKSTANPDRRCLDNLASGGEQWTLADGAFYLFAPNGIGRSKLAAGFERCLGVDSTTRNWRTVQKLDELLGTVII